MKGTIPKAAEKLVISQFGIETWEKILKESGLEEDHIFLIREDIDDELVMTIIKSISKVADLSLVQVLEAFAKYWIHEYAPTVYPSFKFESAKDFVKNIHSIHDVISKTVPNAKPPHFDYTWNNENELLMTYFSERGLMDLAIFLIREIGVKYNEKLEVEKINDKQFKVVFNNS